MALLKRIICFFKGHDQGDLFARSKSGDYITVEQPEADLLPEFRGRLAKSKKVYLLLSLIIRCDNSKDSINFIFLIFNKRIIYKRTK